MFKNKGKWYEWTLLVDVFNNEILAHSVTDRPGYNKPYYDFLDEQKDLKELKKSITPQSLSTPTRELSTHPKHIAWLMKSIT